MPSSSHSIDNSFCGICENKHSQRQGEVFVHRQKSTNEMHTACFLCAKQAIVDNKKMICPLPTCSEQYSLEDATSRLADVYKEVTRNPGGRSASSTSSTARASAATPAEMSELNASLRQAEDMIHQITSTQRMMERVIALSSNTTHTSSHSNTIQTGPSTTSRPPTLRQPRQGLNGARQTLRSLLPNVRRDSRFTPEDISEFQRTIDQMAAVENQMAEIDLLIERQNPRGGQGRPS